MPLTAPQSLPSASSDAATLARQLLRLVGPGWQAPDGSNNAADALARGATLADSRQMLLDTALEAFASLATDLLSEWEALLGIPADDTLPDADRRARLAAYARSQLGGSPQAIAAAVEATASTGGQIMPPVMGAAAFVMAEFLAVPYATVALWAVIPAVMYYMSVFFAVHFEAKRYGLHGVPKNELPAFGHVMLSRGHLFIPIVTIFIGLTMGYSAPLCALVGALMCLPMALLRKSTRAGISWRSVLDALEEGAKNTLAVAMACACAGIVIGCVTITGLGIVFTQIVVGLAQNMLPLALILTAIAGIVLGMGMPTTPAYIVMVSLLVPALIKLGAPTPAAHMFAFYFAILSAITPPVALAVFAAASLAKADLWEAGWAAVRIGAAGFIVPFMFVFEPSLLMIGAWTDILHSFFTASIGVICLAAGMFGYLHRRALLWERILLLIAAILLIKPGLITDLIGFGLLAVVLVSQFALRRNEPHHEVKVQQAD